MRGGVCFEIDCNRNTQQTVTLCASPGIVEGLPHTERREQRVPTWWCSSGWSTPRVELAGAALTSNLLPNRARSYLTQTSPRCASRCARVSWRRLCSTAFACWSLPITARRCGCWLTSHGEQVEHVYCCPVLSPRFGCGCSPCLSNQPTKSGQPSQTPHPPSGRSPRSTARSRRRPPARPPRRRHRCTPRGTSRAASRTAAAACGTPG